MAPIAIAAATAIGAPAATAATIGTVVSAVGTVASLAGTAMSVQQSLRQSQLKKKATALQAEQRRIEEARNRAKVMRDARVKAASLVNTAAGRGVSGSSAVAGGIIGIGSSTDRELGYQSQIGNLANQSDYFTNKQIGIDTLSDITANATSAYDLLESEKTKKVTDATLDIFSNNSQA